MTKEELTKAGYQFNSEECTFYVDKEKKDSFKQPEGFEGWDVEYFDKEEYYNQRIVNDMKVTDDKNKVALYGGPNLAPNECVEQKIFSFNEFGDIEILLYTLERKPIIYNYKGEETISHTNREEYDILTRFAPWRENIKGRKYHITGKTGTHPFFHPDLIKAFEDKTEINTLVITEGFFKAYTATDRGIPTVGLSSITHYRDKKSKTMHPDIFKLMVACKTKRVIILWDGDCLDISTKALQDKEDLYTRPGGFFSAVKKMQASIKDYDATRKLDIFFARIKSEELNGNPKGLDDLIFQFEDDIDSILDDFNKIGAVPSRFIDDSNISSSLKKLYSYFHLHDVDSFYNFHQEKIKDRPFIFSGTQYKWDEEQSKLQMQIPAAAKNYMRIGTEYYKLLMKPDKYNNKSETLARWSKGTIVQDHGKHFINHIDKYDGFINMPEHVDYKRVIDGFYNVYYPLDFEVREGEWTKTEKFLRHIFQEHYELGLDYVKLMYEKPKQVLPILCLVSKENMTGKTTYAQWLKKIFQNNMAIVGNQDLANDFNSFWATKLIVCCDETFLEKKATVEKIKSLSTADKITVNAKGKDQEELDFYAKFILLTNNEENFIYATEDDTRYWVRKVPRIQEKDMNPDLMDDLTEEIPAFLHFLSKREMKVKKKQSRMWFTAEMIKTDALRKVQQNSAPTVEKEVREYIREMFLTYKPDEILMSTRDIKKYVFGNSTRNSDTYINRILKDNLHLKRFEKNGKEVTTRYQFPIVNDKDENQVIMMNGNGRPYVFNIYDFVTKEELDKIDHSMVYIGLNGVRMLENGQTEIEEPAEDKLPFN